MPLPYEAGRITRRVTIAARSGRGAEAPRLPVGGRTVLLEILGDRDLVRRQRVVVVKDAGATRVATGENAGAAWCAQCGRRIEIRELDALGGQAIQAAEAFENVTRKDAAVAVVVLWTADALRVCARRGGAGWGSAGTRRHGRSSAVGMRRAGILRNDRIPRRRHVGAQGLPPELTQAPVRPISQHASRQAVQLWSYQAILPRRLRSKWWGCPVFPVDRWAEERQIRPTEVVQNDENDVGPRGGSRGRRVRGSRCSRNTEHPQGGNENRR